MGTLTAIAIFILVWWTFYKIFTPGGSPRSLFLRKRVKTIPKEERKRKLNIEGVNGHDDNDGSLW